MDGDASLVAVPVVTNSYYNPLPVQRNKFARSQPGSLRAGAQLGKAQLMGDCPTHPTSEPGFLPSAGIFPLVPLCVALICWSGSSHILSPSLSLQLSC